MIDAEGRLQRIDRALRRINQQSITISVHRYETRTRRADYPHTRTEPNNN